MSYFGHDSHVVKIWHCESPCLKFVLRSSDEHREDERFRADDVNLLLKSQTCRQWGRFYSFRVSQHDCSLQYTVCFTRVQRGGEKSASFNTTNLFRANLLERTKEGTTTNLFHHPAQNKELSTAILSSKLKIFFSILLHVRNIVFAEII